MEKGSDHTTLGMRSEWIRSELRPKRKGEEIRPHSAEALGDQDDEAVKLGLLEGDKRRVVPTQ